MGGGKYERHEGATGYVDEHSEAAHITVNSLAFRSNPNKTCKVCITKMLLFALAGQCSLQ